MLSCPRLRALPLCLFPSPRLISWPLGTERYFFTFTDSLTILTLEARPDRPDFANFIGCLTGSPIRTLEASSRLVIHQRHTLAANSGILSGRQQAVDPCTPSLQDLLRTDEFGNLISPVSEISTVSPNQSVTPVIPVAQATPVTRISIQWLLSWVIGLARRLGVDLREIWETATRD
jgi:hypothetical protein